MSDADWCCVHIHRGASRVRIKLAVQPGARRTEVIGIHDGCLKLKIAAPPVDGAANDVVLEFLATQLSVRLRQVMLTSGATARRKIVDIEGVSLEFVQSCLKPQKRQ